MKNSYLQCMAIMLMLSINSLYCQETAQNEGAMPKAAAQEKAANEKSPNCMQRCINGICACSSTFKLLGQLLSDFMHVKELRESVTDLKDRNKTLEQDMKEERQKAQTAGLEAKDLLSKSLHEAKEITKQYAAYLSDHAKSNKELVQAQEKNNEIQAERNKYEKVKAVAQGTLAVIATGYAAVKTAETVYNKATSRISSKDRMDSVQGKNQLSLAKTRYIKLQLDNCLIKHRAEEKSEHGIPAICQDLLITYAELAGEEYLFTIPDQFRNQTY